MSSWPHYAEDEIAAALAVLRSGRVNYWNGEEGRAFEREFATACEARFAVALANGSVALELALHALGIGPGDEVVVTPRSFIASVTAVMLRGAQPVFADIDRDSQNLTAATIAAALTPRTRAVIVVHLAGWPCEMDPILELARAHGLFVIEDCAQAIGARYRGRPVGALGEVGAFSFCTDKIITTAGEGGMLVTDDEALWRRAWSYKDHGKSYEAVYQRQHPPGFRWLHESVGTNWRLPEVQSAIGRVQLRKLEDWVARRRRHAAILTAGLEGVAGLRTPLPPPHVRHACYKHYVFVEPQRLRAGWSRDRILAELAARGLPALSGSCSEIYREKAFAGSPARPPAPLPVARELGETSLMFPVHPTLAERELERMAGGLREIMAAAAR
jgi:dTDP-4-amino-4,6-dideoxygalactose transaminase